LALLEPWLDSRKDIRARLARRHRRSVRVWYTNMFNKLVCCATLVLLSPAIFAVWVAIKRSAPPKMVIGQERSSQAVKDASPVLLTIKPVLVCVSQQHVGKSKISAKRAISA